MENPICSQEFLDSLNCEKEGHEARALEFVCNHPDCTDRLLCSVCLIKEHSHHISNIMMLKDALKEEESDQTTNKNSYSMNSSEEILKILANPDTYLKSFNENLAEKEKEVTDCLLQLLKEFSDQNRKSFDETTEVFNLMKEKYCKCIHELYSDSFQKEEQEEEIVIESENQLKDYIEENLKESREVKDDSNLPQSYFVLKILENFKIRVNKNWSNNLLENAAKLIKFPTTNLKDFTQHRLNIYTPVVFKNPEKLKALQTIATPHKKSIYRILLIDEKYFATASEDSSIIIWDAINFTQVKTLQGHSDRIWALIKLGNDYIASGSSDQKIKIWDYKNFTTAKVLSGHSAFVTSLLEIKSNILVSGSHDKTLKFWDYKNAKMYKNYKNDGQGKVMTMIMLSGEELAVGSDSNINFINIADGKISAKLLGHTGLVKDLLLLDDLQTLLSSSDDFTVRMWNVYTGTCKQVFKGHTSSCNKILLYNPSVFVTASDDSTIRFWNFEKGNAIATLNDHESWVVNLAITRSGQLISVGADKKIHIWGDES